MGDESEVITIPKGIHHTEHETSGVDEIDVTDLAGALADPQFCHYPATKEIFIMPWALDAIQQPNGIQIDGGGDRARFRLLVPHDFTAIVALEIIFIPIENAANMHFDIRTYYGAYNGGETWNVHTEVDATRDIGAVTINENYPHSITDLVDIAALVAGDLLVVIVEYDATVIDSNSIVSGLRLRYS